MQKAYETSFIQGIKSGLLHPVAYSRYDLQDWVYLHEVGEIYGAVCDQPGKACSDDWREFFRQESEDYERYAGDYPGRYYVEADVDEVVDVNPATEVRGMSLFVAHFVLGLCSIRTREF